MTTLGFSDSSCRNGAVEFVEQLGSDSVRDLFRIESMSPHPQWTESQFASEFLVASSRISGLFASELIGFAVVRNVLDEVHLLNLVIDPSFRGRGWGKLLLQKILSAAKCRDARWVLLECRESNSVARAMYQQQGFVPVGTRANYYSNPDEGACLYTADLFGRPPAWVPHTQPTACAHNAEPTSKNVIFPAQRNAATPPVFAHISSALRPLATVDDEGSRLEPAFIRQVA